MPAQRRSTFRRLTVGNQQVNASTPVFGTHRAVDSQSASGQSGGHTDPVVMPSSLLGVPDTRYRGDNRPVLTPTGKNLG